MAEHGRPTKTVDLTITEYKQQKRNGLKDGEIARIAGVGRTTFAAWKKENGLIGIRHWGKESMVRPKTARAERKLKERLNRIKELRASYWDNRSIAKELGIAMWTLHQMIKLYLPEELRKSPNYFTEEQKRRIKENGVLTATVISRLRAGDDFETAIRPVEKKEFFTPEQSKIIREKGMIRSTVRSRMVNNNMTFEDAVNTPLKTKVKKGRKVKNGRNKTN